MCRDVFAFAVWVGVFGYLFSGSQGPCICAAGLGRFLNGITDEMKQRYRERLFAVTDKNLIDVAGR